MYKKPRKRRIQLTAEFIMPITVNTNQKIQIFLKAWAVKIIKNCNQIIMSFQAQLRKKELGKSHRFCSALTLDR
jgi:hypothetical protein